MIVERLVASKPAALPAIPDASAPARDVADDAAFARPAAATPTPAADRAGRWRARHDLARLRAETERVKVLADFVARPVHAHGGAEPDPDVVTAYNLAVEAALIGIRRAARSVPG